MTQPPLPLATLGHLPQMDAKSMRQFGGEKPLTPSPLPPSTAATTLRLGSEPPPLRTERGD